MRRSYVLLACVLLACIATVVMAQDGMSDASPVPRLRKRLAAKPAEESVRGDDDDADLDDDADDDDADDDADAGEPDDLDGPPASTPLRHHRTQQDDDDNDHEDEDEEDARERLPLSRSRVVDDGSVVRGKPEQTHFVSAFLSSLSVIIVSEIGDKTFFIAAILAMKHPRVQIFSSAISALALMTILSAALGNIAPKILSPTLTFWLATGLFFFFGAKLLHQAYLMPPGKTSDEIDEVEEQLEKVEHDEANGDPELGGSRTKRQNVQDQVFQILRKWFTPVWLQCFTMTFVAEWGDRSQIATIALAAAKNVFGVTLGGILGHSICTGGAVLVGKAAASKISERAVSVLGGACFLLCGLYAVFTGPELETA